MHLGVVFEADLNLETLERQVYSILDWLGDVGGLTEALVYSSMLVLGFLHYG